MLIHFHKCVISFLISQQKNRHPSPTSLLNSIVNLLHGDKVDRTYFLSFFEKGKQAKPRCGQQAPSHGEAIDWLCGAAVGLTQLCCCVSASLASFSSLSPKESYGSIRHGTFRRPLHHAMGPCRGENQAPQPSPPSIYSAADWRGVGLGDNNSRRKIPYPWSSAWPTWRIFRFGNLRARYIYKARASLLP